MSVPAAVHPDPVSRFASPPPPSAPAGSPFVATIQYVVPAAMSTGGVIGKSRHPLPEETSSDQRIGVPLGDPPASACSVTFSASPWGGRVCTWRDTLNRTKDSPAVNDWATRPAATPG